MREAFRQRGRYREPHHATRFAILPNRRTGVKEGVLLQQLSRPRSSIPHPR